MGKLVKVYGEYKKSKKSSAAVYVFLRTLVVICMILQIMRGQYENAFMCLLALVLLLLPIMAQHRFKIELPNVLEIFISFFIFAALILGEIYHFYGNIPHWDTILHTINGFLCAGIGFAFVDLFNKNSKKISMSPLYVALFAFCFSMTVGVCWEFFEYGMDKIFLKNTQKDEIVTTISISNLKQFQNNDTGIVKDIAKTIVYDNEGSELLVINGGYLDIGLNDTMKDLIVNFIGAIAFSTLGYVYIKNRDKYRFTENFIPKKSVVDE